MPQKKPKKKKVSAIATGAKGTAHSEMLSRMSNLAKQQREYEDRKRIKKYKKVASGIKSRMKTGGKMYKSFK